MQYRGALHLHSSYSYDARLTLLELKALCKEHGLSFALMTEHTDELTKERAAAFIEECRALSDEEFLFVPGFEISYKDTHVLVPGCEYFLTPHATETELLEWKKHAPLAILAHPHRNGYRTDHIPAGVLDGIEIWNSQYDGKQVPRNGARHLYTRLRTASPSLQAFAGWDLHRQAHRGGPTLVVELRELSKEHILAALCDGRYTSESSLVTVAASGALIRGGGIRTVLLSSFFVFSIRMFKAINRVLSWVGLKLPSSLVALLRERL